MLTNGSIHEGPSEGLRVLAILGKVLGRASFRLDRTLATCVLKQLLRYLTIDNAFIDRFG